MKIGLDVHGVIDHIPNQLRKLAELVITDGGEVHIITGGDRGRTLDQIYGLKFPFTHFFSIQNYLNQNYFHHNIGINLVDGKYLYPDYLWDAAKGLYCKENKIDLHFDDSPEYRDYFETPFFYFKRKKYDDVV